MWEVLEVSRDNPYAEIREAETKAKDHADQARMWANRANDAAEESRDEAMLSRAALSTAHSQAAISTMVAAGCISIQDLKR